MLGWSLYQKAQPGDGSYEQTCRLHLGVLEFR